MEYVTKYVKRFVEQIRKRHEEPFRGYGVQNPDCGDGFLRYNRRKKDPRCKLDASHGGSLPTGKEGKRTCHSASEAQIWDIQGALEQIPQMHLGKLTDGSDWNKYGRPSFQPQISRETPNGRTPLKKEK